MALVGHLVDAAQRNGHEERAPDGGDATSNEQLCRNLAHMIGAWPQLTSRSLPCNKRCGVGVLEGSSEYARVMTPSAAPCSSTCSELARS